MKKITATLILVSSIFGFSSLFGEGNPFAGELKTGTNFSFQQKAPYYSELRKKETFYKIDYTRWIPQNGNGHVIIYNHGLQSHRAWYFSTAEKLRERGFTVYAFDRIGSGTSSRAFGQEGWFLGLEEFLPFLPGVDLVRRPGHIRDFNQFLESLDRMKAIAKRENPGKKLHIWGNSYGAKIVTAYLLDEKRAADVTSSIFTTPGLYRNNESMPLTFSKLSLLFMKNTDKVPTPIVARNQDRGATWFTSMNVWFKKISNDVLSLRHMTRRFAFQTRAMDSMIQEQAVENGSLTKSKRFYLMVQGDLMMDNVKMLTHINKNKKNSYHKFYEGGVDHKHFLAFSSDADTALADISAYLLKEK